MYLQDCLL